MIVSKTVCYVPTFSVKWRFGRAVEKAYFNPCDDVVFALEDCLAEIVTFPEDDFNLEKAKEECLARLKTLSESQPDYKFSGLRIEKKMIFVIDNREEVWRAE